MNQEVDLDHDTEEEFWNSLRGDNVADFKEPRLRETEDYAELTCIIYPDDRLYLIWGYVIIILLLYTAIVTPFAIALLDVDQ